jgi:hypothetical protein
MCSKHHGAGSWTTYRESRRLGHIVRRPRFHAHARSFPQLICVDSRSVSKRLKSLPLLGSAHASDIQIIYGGQDLTDYLIHFATNLNPNGGSHAEWPQYTASSPRLLTLYDAPVPTNITLDTYRAEGMKFLTKLSLEHPM